MTSKEFSSLNGLLLTDKKSVEEAVSPAHSGCDQVKFVQTDSRITQRIFRLENKTSEFAQAIGRIDGNIRTIQWQNGILLTAVCGTGGALLYWFMKGELSKKPKPGDVEKMIKNAAKRQALKLQAEQAQAASKVVKG
ncbi:hypothetical protein B9Z19DRAFT_1126054 [Tuber borchii]|uniref:Uncharacterized protein n=1 Tax=Tuber borchii TaxID=42251 RepID=A0A2T6ZTH8_TUBBO|nr:hypothetical protein B9Z19DRAFT_1126054 [Tuber borchii]